MSQDPPSQVPPTEYARWGNPANYLAHWNHRSAFAAALCHDSKVICDIGAGAQTLRRLLPNKTYLPADLDVNLLTPDTVPCELNLGNYPDAYLRRADTVTLLGVLEYLADDRIPALFTKLAEHCTILIFSYNPIDIADQDRSANGWVNGFTTGQLMELCSHAGFEVDHFQRIDNTQVLVRARRERPTTNGSS